MNKSLIFLCGMAISFASLVQASGQAQAQTPPDRYMLVLLDRSGSMSRLRSDGSGQTRWEAAKQRGIDKINQFMIVPGALNVAVWTFQSNSATNWTNGFVSPAGAISQIQSLPGPTGSTPLARGVCDAVDALVAATSFPPSRIIQLNSDGLENSTPTSHSCYGIHSSSNTPPFSTGSWENKVYNKVQGTTVYVDVFGSNINRIGSGSVISETGADRTHSTEATSMSTFFSALATSTGGAYTVVNDSAPLPVSGDVNGDFCVDDQDLNSVFGQYGMSVPPGDPANDVNQDGTIDYYDYLQVWNNYGQGCP